MTAESLQRSGKRIQRFSSLRYRLLTLVLVPLLLLTGTVILLAAKWSSDYTYEQLFTKVNTDLRVAHDSFLGIQKDQQRELEWLANSSALVQRLAANDLEALQNLLDTQRTLAGFDFLKLLSADGRRILYRRAWRQHRFRNSVIADRVLEFPKSASPFGGATGIEIYQAEEWKLEYGVEGSTVVLPLVETARAAPTRRINENRAMMIRSLQPVLDSSGRRIALLEGGLLLNRNFAFVDEIRDLVYGPGSLAPGSRGTVTVFLDDVRITTNVPASDQTRALGTRVSSEVRDTVLGRGETWIDRAFVVNDWYISAYEPIVDVAGQRVGMLYTGYLEAPFRQDMYKAIAWVSALVLGGSLLAGLAAIVGARSIFEPIESMTEVVRATAAGQSRRIGPIPAGNEISELAAQFDGMLDTMEMHRERIEQDALLLEEKVQTRTAELELQNRRLQDSIVLLHQTRQQLATAEKLAALGELTAGVAHEINNPTAVILGNMDILIAELADSRDDLQVEIDLIIEQVYRIRSITDRLLQYSRSGTFYEPQNDAGSGDFQPAPGNVSAQLPAGIFNIRSAVPESTLGTDSRVSGLSEFSPESFDPVILEDLIRDTLKLLGHEFNGRQISLSHKNTGKLMALIDRQELQQVLLNLITNAAQSIGTGGRIDVETRDHPDSTLSIIVRDNGCGIDESHLRRVFDPFFTSGKTRGTGLGLSVSYGIVRRFGGDIQVQSTIGEGSEFTVTLPGIYSRADSGLQAVSVESLGVK